MAESHISDELWQEFHEVVNMTSRELSDWLRTEATGEDGRATEGLPELEVGEAVVAILAKRRTDLTPDDVDTMQHVAVGQHGEVDRLARPVVERDLLELALRRRGGRVVVAFVRRGGGGHRQRGQAEGGADGGREPCAEGVLHQGSPVPENGAEPTSNVGT